MPPIDESFTSFIDQFHSSVGVFESRYQTNGFYLLIKHKMLAGGFIDRKSAHQPIADQKSGHKEWDDLPRSIALEQLRSDERWIRLPCTIHKISGDHPHNLPIAKTCLSVPPTARPHIQYPE